MSRPVRLVGILALYASGLNADSSLAPALEWVQTLGGSGTNQVTAAAADSHGDLYITGSTTSLDFPVTSAAQANAGASTIYSINSATGAAQKLYPPGMPAPSSLAVDPGNPKYVYATAGNAVWRSTDGGATWAGLPAFSSAVRVQFVAVDPFASATLYAATSPQGVFKSTDGGQTWTAINSGIPPATDGSTNA